MLTHWVWGTAYGHELLPVWVFNCLIYTFWCSILDYIHLPLDAPPRIGVLYANQCSNVLLHTWWINHPNWNQETWLVSSATFSESISSYFVSQMLTFISFYKAPWDLWIKTLFKTYHDSCHSLFLRANSLPRHSGKEWNEYDVTMNATCPYSHGCSLAEQRQFCLAHGFIYKKAHCISLLYTTFSGNLHFYCASSNKTSENTYACH